MDQHDDLHSSENPSENSAEESVELSESGDAGAGKKKSNTILYAGFVVLVAVAGTVGFKIMTAHHPSAAPAQAPQAQQAPVAPASAPTAAPAPTPAPAQLTPPPAAPVSASDTGLPNMNAASDASAPGAASAPSNDLSSASAPAPSLSMGASDTAPPPVAPSVTPGVGATPGLNAAPAQPVTPSTVTPTTPAVVSTPGTGDTRDLNNSLSHLSDQMGSLESTLKTLISNTNDKIDTTNQKVDTLASRVDKLEAKAGIKAAASDTSTADTSAGTTDAGTKAPVKAKATVKYHRPVVRHHVVTGHAERRTGNTVELINGDAPAVVAPARAHGDVLFSKPVASENSVEKVAPASSNGYTVKAILPGRAWVQSADGTATTYGVGDTLPDGRRVSKIDPDTGVIDNHGHRWPN